MCYMNGVLSHSLYESYMLSDIWRLFLKWPKWQIYTFISFYRCSRCLHIEAVPGHFYWICSDVTSQINETMFVLGKTEVTEVNWEPEVVMGTVFENHGKVSKQWNSRGHTEVIQRSEHVWRGGALAQTQFLSPQSKKVADSNPAGLFVWSLHSAPPEWISSISAVYIPPCTNASTNQLLYSL